MLTYEINDTIDIPHEDCTQLMADLLSFSQALCKQTHRIGERLCQEVMHATQGKAMLLFSCQSSSVGKDIPFHVSVSFPVRFRNRTYGTLDIAPDSAHPKFPALPLPVAQLLAHVCGSLLYTLELSAFIEGQCQLLDCQDPEQLTKREREVLELICLGYDQQAIATKLHIASATVETHRKHIAEKLGIHCERDIPLAAYRTNLFSILD